MSPSIHAHTNSQRRKLYPRRVAGLLGLMVGATTSFGVLGCGGSNGDQPGQDSGTVNPKADASSNSSTGGSGSGGNSGSGGSAIGTGGATTGTGGGTTSGSGGNVVTASGGSSNSGGSSTGGSAAAGGTGGTATGGSGTGGRGGAAAGTGGTSSVGSGGSTMMMGACPTYGASARAKCTGTSSIACHFGGNPGNYNVTFVVGGSTAGKTEVQTEAVRELVVSANTPASQTQCYSFTVNVRQPEGQPVENGPNDGTPGLDMYFKGSAPLLSDITYAPVTSAPTMLYIAGDSTVCDQGVADGNYDGWGQEVPALFTAGLSVANYADSGESSASFLGSSSLWGAIMGAIKPNDIVLIQFGHNDKTNAAAAAYKANMTKYVTDAKAKNAIPILVTPTARAQFTGTTVNPQHIVNGVDYPQTVRDIGASENVPVIDLTAQTVAWLMQVGPNGWQAYHAKGSTGSADASHTNKAGAQVIAGFVHDSINKLNIAALQKFLR